MRWPWEPEVIYVPEPKPTEPPPPPLFTPDQERRIDACKTARSLLRPYDRDENGPSPDDVIELATYIIDNNYQEAQ
jgi:hypothetical protein